LSKRHFIVWVDSDTGVSEWLASWFINSAGVNGSFLLDRKSLKIFSITGSFELTKPGVFEQQFLIFTTSEPISISLSSEANRALQAEQIQ
jgi:hypothetical protein